MPHLTGSPVPRFSARSATSILFFASPECTNHTCAKGSRPRDEESRQTANYVTSFARALSPRWIVLENVVQMRNWHGYAPLIDDLSALGYNVLPLVLDAVDFGVPQTRRRLFLLCDREAMPLEVALTTKRRLRARTARDVIQLDGPWDSRPLYSKNRAHDTIARAERAIDELGKANLSSSSTTVQTEAAGGRRLTVPCEPSPRLIVSA